MAAAWTPAPDARIRRTMAALDEALDGPGEMAFYDWSHATGAFELVATSGTTIEFPGRLPLPTHTDLDTGSLAPSGLPDGYALRAVRDAAALVGAIAVPIDGPWNTFADSIAAQLAQLAEAAFRDDLHDTLLQPVEFRASRDEFFRSLAELAALASDMEFVVIREQDGVDLRCVAHDGFDVAGGVDASALDVALGEVPLFDHVMRTGQMRAMRSLREAAATDVGDLAGRSAFQGIESFVVFPLRHGDVVTGTIGLCSRYRGMLSAGRLAALATVARSVEVAIANFANFHRTLDDLSDLSRVAVSITALEVAQSARHEAKALIGNMLGQLTILQQHISQRDLRSALYDIEALKGHANRMNLSIDKIKSATQPPRQLVQQVDLEDVWNEARDQVISRLNELKIRTTYSGPRLTIDAYREWLRHVFLNLLLNSADAFEGRNRKGERRIRLRYRDEAAIDGAIVLRYEDSAGGIRTEEFNRVENPEDLPLERLIFEPGVTTKNDGSGWGMFLVREILQRHGGGIEPVALRSGGGVVFDITLPVRLDA